jgi:hypothetical protein
MRAAGDLEGQDWLGPAMSDGLLGVPQARFRIAQPFKQGDVLAPRQLCNGPLHNSRIGPRARESPHVLQVSRGQPSHLGKRGLQILGETIDDSRAPALACLSIENHPSDVPVKQDHGRIRGQNDTQAFLPNAVFDFGQRRGVVLRKIGSHGGHREQCLLARATADLSGILRWMSHGLGSGTRLECALLHQVFSVRGPIAGLVGSALHF